MGKPIRVQRKRTKGWKMPKNTIYVGRPSRWGNEFEVDDRVTRKVAVERYALHLRDYFNFTDRQFRKAFAPWPIKSNQLEEWVAPLKGKNLACWCPLNEPCHADLLLELSNIKENLNEDQE